MCAKSQFAELSELPIQLKTTCGVPWQRGPRHLTSWWEMQKFSLSTYVNVAGNLAAIGQQFAHASTLPLSRSNLKSLSQQLSERVPECREIGLPVSARQFEAAAESLLEVSAMEQYLAGHAAQMIVDLQNAMMAEMQTQLFLWVQADRSAYFEQPQLFGSKVAHRFPLTDQDVRASGNCYASDNYTACVFHCMRVLEKGLHEFSDYLAVPFSVPVELQNWQNIIDQIEKEIRLREQTLPKGIAKSNELQVLSQAAVQFRYFKEAWRNHVAHARVTYDNVEALRIMNHVHQFMEALCDIL